MEPALTEEVSAALTNGQAVVALESTLVTHGLPYPDNIRTARSVEDIVRQEGAAPATIAVIGGTIKIGLTEEDFYAIGKQPDILKLNAADIPLAVAAGKSGGTTVAGTMFCAALAGINIFATGGIGGVHRNAGYTGDISQDLEALATYNVAVVTAGAKAILDLPRTLEYLETKAVPVIGYGTDEFPAFWTRHSGLPLSWRIETPEEAARIMQTRKELQATGGIIIANPVTEDMSLPAEDMEGFIEQALTDARQHKIAGKAVTPFLLKRMRELTDGRSLAPNITLLENNARLAARIARKAISTT